MPLDDDDDRGVDISDVLGAVIADEDAAVLEENENPVEVVAGLGADCVAAEGAGEANENVGLGADELEVEANAILPNGFDLVDCDGSFPATVVAVGCADDSNFVEAKGLEDAAGCFGEAAGMVWGAEGTPPTVPLPPPPNFRLETLTIFRR